MEIIPLRDLIQDDLGNFYEVVELKANKVTLVNAVVFNSFKRLLSINTIDDLYKERGYTKTVALGQPGTDAVKIKIEMLQRESNPGNIYKLSDVMKQYAVELDPLYEREVSNR